MKGEDRSVSQWRSAKVFWKRDMPIDVASLILLNYPRIDFFTRFN